MNKQEFLARLRKGLAGLPQGDIEERLAFYGEMIDDQMEEGLSEEEAVSAVGGVDEIVAQVVADIPLTKIAKARIKPQRRLSAGEVILLVLGSPIWLSLGIALFAVVVSLYIVLWSLIVVVWAIFVCAIACFIGGVLQCIILIVSGNVVSGLAMLAAGIACAGLAVFAFYVSKAATRGIFTLTKNMAIWLKNCFIKKEKAQ